MKIARTAGVVAAVCLALLVLFDISFSFGFALPREKAEPDPQIEAEYARCYELKDREIHATAFGTIDNPDVQKEFIASNRARAGRECRALHPQATIVVRQPLRIKLFEFEPRFW